mmetsp:Transcript_88865/g.240953  ORF Transcript_88865/g.240953 Transcript_88865/m.240953 type:complete len:434 (+) Transcript_88865:46-1347(+)
MRRLQAHERIDRDVTRRYTIGSRLGRGCYGVVWEVFPRAGGGQGGAAPRGSVVATGAARRHETKSSKASFGSASTFGAASGAADPAPEPQSFALKKVLQAFGTEADAQRTYREVSYLLEFRGHRNILEVAEVLCSPDDRHLYIVSHMYDSDLSKALRCRAVRAAHQPYIVYQVLRALKYVHSAEVMHRDVKPANLLINADCRVALCDFGWARLSPVDASPDDVEGLEMTAYASTRWYRPPELLLGARRYKIAVDMWAVGCVAAEVVLEAPLFPGTSTIDMWDKQLETLGKPTPTDVEAMEAEYASYVLNTWPITAPGSPLASILPAQSATVELLDFLELLLQFNPDKRLSSAEALQHPYVAAHHNPDDEPEFGRVLTLPLPDTAKLTTMRYRDQVYADALRLPAAKARVDALRRTHLLSGAASAPGLRGADAV